MRVGQTIGLVKMHLNKPELVRRALFLEGPSGIGKSQGVVQAAKDEGVPLIDIRLSQFDPVDFRGVPFVEEGRTCWAVPEFFPDKKQPRGVIFLDEMTSAHPQVFAPAYQLVLERRVGDYFLPPGWLVVAAGNRTNDRGITNQIPAPLMNRFVWVTVEPHLEDFTNWAIGAGLSTRIIAFLHVRADMLHKFDPSSEIRPFPTPRSWEMANEYVTLPTTERLELMSGCVGKEAASSFEVFERVYHDIPTVDEVLHTPTKAKVPTELGGMYAITVGLAAIVSVKTFAAVNQYLERLKPEFSMLCVRIATDRVPNLHVSEGYKDWAQRHGNVFNRRA